MPIPFKALLMSAIVATNVPVSAATGLRPALTGDWGGSQARLTLFDDGGRLQLGCASVAIAAGIHPDANGKFKSPARYEAYASGPMDADTPPKLIDVILRGEIKDDVMHLAFATGKGAAQRYTLERGRRVKIINCY